MSPRDVFDVPLEDPFLLEELLLLADLVVATNRSTGPLDLSDVDRLLGVPQRKFCGCGSRVGWSVKIGWLVGDDPGFGLR